MGCENIVRPIWFKVDGRTVYRECSSCEHVMFGKDNIYCVVEVMPVKLDQTFNRTCGLWKLTSKFIGGEVVL